MTINSFEYRHGARFSGIFRITHFQQRTARNGSKYSAMTLEDATGSIRAYAWSEMATLNLKAFDCARLAGTIRALNDAWIVNILHAEPFQGELENPIQLIPRSVCPLPALLDRLDELLKALSHEPLRRFVNAVFSDDAITFPFVAAPASKRHHHCNFGGLLEHSLECAGMVSRFVEFPKAELDLALIGALFHDVGKIRTLKSTGKLSHIGYVCSHDALTLEVLAPHLSYLDSICPDAAIALRYLWTWRNQRYQRQFPLLTIAETIAASDRISSGLNVQEAAFRDEPDWKQFASYGENNSFWRPRLELKG